MTLNVIKVFSPHYFQGVVTVNFEFLNCSNATVECASTAASLYRCPDYSPIPYSAKFAFVWHFEFAIFFGYFVQSSYSYQKD